LTGPLFALALVLVAALAWDAHRRYVLAVVATRKHAAEEIALVRAEAVRVSEHVGRLEAAHATTLEELRRLRAKLPESPIVPKGPR